MNQIRETRLFPESGDAPRMGRLALWLTLVLILIAGRGFAQVEEEKGDKKAAPPSGIFSLTLENDVFAGTDRGYSQGARIMWVSPEAGEGSGRIRLPRWIDSLSRRFSALPEAESRRFISVFLGQAMYTPNDIIIPDPPAWDRPYAGYTYVGLGFHTRDSSSMDTVELRAGLVGPHSFAGDTQIVFHKIFGFKRARGWSHQLRDEPVLSIAYDHKEKAGLRPGRRGFGADAVVHGGGSLSNAFTGGTAGIELRAGWNLPEDFGTAPIQPGTYSAALFEESRQRRAGEPGFRVHFFLALQGHVVLRDIFLDGNTFGGGPRVEKYPFRADVMAGIAFRLRRLKFSFGYVAMTKQFETQTRPYAYGTMNLAFTLRD
jgi:hypothetical protein